MSRSIHDQLCRMAAEARPVVCSASAPGNGEPARTVYLVVVAGAVFVDHQDLADQIAQEINRALGGVRRELKQRGILGEP